MKNPFMPDGVWTIDANTNVRYEYLEKVKAHPNPVIEKENFESVSLLHSLYINPEVNFTQFLVVFNQARVRAGYSKINYTNEK